MTYTGYSGPLLSARNRNILGFSAFYITEMKAPIFRYHLNQADFRWAFPTTVSLLHISVPFNEKEERHWSARMSLSMFSVIVGLLQEISFSTIARLMISGELFVVFFLCAKTLLLSSLESLTNS